MKKILLLFFAVIITFAIQAQNPIPNGDFETWTSGTYNYPLGYPYTSNRQNFMRYSLPFNELRTTDSYHGTYAVEMMTNATAADTSGGYFVNTPDTEGMSWHGGFPYTQTPTGVRGYYKYNVATADSGLVLAAFSKNGSSIGMYFFKVGGVKTDYTLFDFKFDPPLPMAPDSVIFAATSSNFLKFNGLPGSTLLIDSVSFTGVASQPALLNGDFESWQSETLYKPTGWYMEEQGTQRTSDAFSGNWAVELTTTLGNENNAPAARTGRISTGYYSNSCNCMKGGLPYALSQDILEFQYKYTPAVPTDKANIFLSFKKNGLNIYGTGQELDPSTDYKYVEIPFNMGGMIPDTMMIEIQSSLWSNKTTDYVGAVLKIDDLNLKSQLTGIKSETTNNIISLYPNPSSGKVKIRLSDSKLLDNGQIEIYNMTGKKVYGSEIKIQNSDIDLTALPNGIYIVKIYDGVTVNTSKFVKH